jgi:hypothetical protein
MQWSVALRSESHPVLKLCSGHSSFSGCVGSSVGRQPLPTFAELCTRNRNNPSCLPCTAARVRSTAALESWYITRPSSSSGRLCGPKSHDSRIRPSNWHNASPLSSGRLLIPVGLPQFRSRRSVHSAIYKVRRFSSAADDLLHIVPPIDIPKRRQNTSCSAPVMTATWS